MKRYIAIVSMFLVLVTFSSAPTSFAETSGNGAAFFTPFSNDSISTFNARGISYVDPNNHDFSKSNPEARYKSCDLKSANSSSWQSWKSGGQSSGDVCAFGPSSLIP